MLGFFKCIYASCIGMAYYAQVDIYNKLLQQRNGMSSVSAGLTSVNLKVDNVFSMSRYARVGGLTIDLGREFHSSRSINGDREQVKVYNMAAGMISSYMEGHFNGIFHCNLII